MRMLPYFSALTSRNPGGGIAPDRLRAGCGAAGLRSAALVLVLGFSPFAAQAACSDEPKAKVDWSGCEKQRLIMGKANLQGAKLSGTQFDGSDFAQANLAGADLSKSSLDRVRLSGADLAGANMVQATAYRTNFSAAKLVGADLSKAELIRANFKSADLTNANLERAELLRITLEGATLTGANLTSTDLSRATLGKAKLGGTKFAHARMFQARLEDADLTAAVGLTQAQLDTACGNAQTRLPAGLKPPSSWPCPKDD